MMKVRVIKEFEFEAAHALDGYEGKCRDIHGHSYKLSISVLGETIEDTKEPCCGMVIDFGDLKRIVQEHVIQRFDHYLILRVDSRFKGIEHKNDRVRYVAYQPTCENMLIDIVKTLIQQLPNEVSLVEANLRETGNSYAEWHQSDNL